ncbi:MAG: 6-pyruvoyl tetrahydropterin synthase family protein [Actinobacteria bacterium]|nr:6-pyruvoyl tetrahydropterin synthase family protein [Actinomycetota bacterium]
MADYRISVEKEHLSFSAAHFLIFGQKCERLHGHNYAVSVELEGELNETGYVFDFIELKRLAAWVCGSLDHRTLLPTKNVNLDIETKDDEVTVKFGVKRFIFPGEDVHFLPVENITAELLATHICEQISGHLRSAGIDNLIAVTVRVDESPGQSAFYREEFG